MYHRHVIKYDSLLNNPGVKETASDYKYDD